MNDIVDSAAPAASAAARLPEPGPDDLRWAEEMFEEWQRLLADAPRLPAISASRAGAATRDSGAADADHC